MERSRQWRCVIHPCRQEAGLSIFVLVLSCWTKLVSSRSGWCDMFRSIDELQPYQVHQPGMRNRDARGPAEISINRIILVTTIADQGKAVPGIDDDDLFI